VRGVLSYYPHDLVGLHCRIPTEYAQEERARRRKLAECDTRVFCVIQITCAVMVSFITYFVEFQPSSEVEDPTWCNFMSFMALPLTRSFFYCMIGLLAVDPSKFMALPAVVSTMKEEPGLFWRMHYEFDVPMEYVGQQRVRSAKLAGFSCLVWGVLATVYFFIGLIMAIPLVFAFLFFPMLLALFWISGFSMYQSPLTVSAMVCRDRDSETEIDYTDLIFGQGLSYSATALSGATKAEDKPKDGEATEDKLEDGQATEDKPKDGQAMEDKPKNGEVTEDKLEDGQATEAQPKDGEAAEEKLEDGQATEGQPKYKVTYDDIYGEENKQRSGYNTYKEVPILAIACIMVPTIICYSTVHYGLLYVGVDWGYIFATSFVQLFGEAAFSFGSIGKLIFAVPDVSSPAINFSLGFSYGGMITGFLVPQLSVLLYHARERWRAYELGRVGATDMVAPEANIEMGEVANAMVDAAAELEESARNAVKGGVDAAKDVSRSAAEVAVDAAEDLAEIVVDEAIGEIPKDVDDLKTMAKEAAVAKAGEYAEDMAKQALGLDEKAENEEDAKQEQKTQDEEEKQTTRESEEAAGKSFFSGIFGKGKTALASGGD